MSHAEQMAFAFASLDFPGQSMVTLDQMAKRLGVSINHLLNECEHGALCGIDLKGARATRRFVRVPIESYRAYVVARMTGPFRRDFIRDLPKHILRELQAEIKDALAA